MVLRSGSFCVSPRALFLSLAPLDGSVKTLKKLVALKEQPFFVFHDKAAELGLVRA